VEPAVCLDDSDCDITRFGPRRCDPEAGTCAYCRTDDDCRASRRCAHDPFAGEPICTEPERCTDHADCLPGRRCIPSTGSCVFDDVCIDDAREPNDDPAQADDNERSHLAEARYTGLSLCGTSPDWYRVRVPPGRGLAVTMRHLVPFDDLNLDVFAADTPEAPVARGSGAQNAKRAAVPGYLPGGGFSYVRVTSLRGGSNFYSLELDLPECVDDAREEDDTAAAARRVEEALPGWLCGPDQDWAWLEAPAGATVVADLVHPAGGRALTLRHTTTPERTGSGRNGRDVAGGVTLRAPTGTGGSQWLAVSAEGGVRAPYHLEVSLVSGDCPDDEREENDGRLTPARLEPGSNRSLRACPSDPDWYAIPLLAGDGVEVRAFSEPRGVLDAALLPPVAGAEPPEVVARPDPEGVVRLGRAPQSGDWLLRVTSPVAADYRLDLVEVAGGYCVNDPYEPNDEVGEERLLEPGAVPLVLCPDDKDRFAVSLDEGSVLEATVEYVSAEGDGLGLALFGPRGRLLEESGDGGGRERVRTRVREGGRHTLRVGHLASATETPYTLSLGVEPVNDRCDGAIPLVDGDHVRGSTARATHDLQGSCGGVGADLVYELELAEPSGVEVTLTPDADAFPGVLYLRSRCGDPATEVACVREGDGNARVLRHPYLRGGTWTLVVDGADRRRGGNFGLEVRVVPGGICFADGGEPNDTPEWAFELAPGQHGGLGLCPGDEDWYWVEVPADRDLAAWLTPAAGAEALLLQVGLPGVEEPLAGPAAGPVELLVPLGEAGPYVLGVTGGPGDYGLRLELLDRQRPEDSCLAPPLLEPGGPVPGDTRELHDFTLGGCGNPPGAASRAPEAVYRVSLAEQSSLKATVTGGFDKVVYLRRFCEAPATELDCVDDWVDPAEVLEHPHLDPGDYYLFVDGFSDAAGPYEVTLSVRDPFFPPPNDTCDDAIVLRADEEVEGTTRLAADDYSSSCTRRGHAAPDVVYRFDLGDVTRVVLTLEAERRAADGGNFDSVLYLRDDCRRDTPPIRCVDEPEPQVIDAVLGAGEYWVFVDGWREGEGNFTLRYERLPVE